MDEVTLVVECASQSGEPVDRLASELRGALGLRIGLRRAPSGSLPRAELKARRLVRING